ncbi:hypothetical protein JTB14_028644 [Gonioctena quinquepunctata]|nr:hypothetical protein JTB14_028644 [Gonioctena quinquepunctata]
MITHLNGYDDLLMTRKVVILNDDHKEMSEQNIITTRNDLQNRYKARRNSRARQRKKEKKLLSMKTLNNLNEKSQEFMNIVKPCYVKMLRESHIDKMYRDVGNSSNTNSVSSSRYKSPPKSAVRKCNTVWVINMFMSKLIDNEQKFRTEMAFIKPVLVINEFNFTIVKFASEFSKSNIVVAVNEFRQFPEAFLKNNVFIEAVDIGYVKLIDSDILYRYLLGEIGPQSPQKINV